MGQTVSHQYGGIYSPDPQMVREKIFSSKIKNNFISFTKAICPKCGEYRLTRVNYVMGAYAICNVIILILAK